MAFFSFKNMACTSRACALVKHQKEISTAIISCLLHIFLWSPLLTTSATKESASQIYVFCEHKWFSLQPPLNL